VRDDDERLAALIDNELDEKEKAELLERLAQDEALRDRLAALRRDRERLVASFDALLGQAPLERLRAAIPAADAAPPAPRKRASIAWLELAAGIAFGFLIAGAAFWVGFGPGVRDERDDWRQAVVDYMELYTTDTFVLANPDGATQGKQLQAVSVRVGVDLKPEKLAVPGLRYRTALNLSYDGAPLGEIAYTDASGAPALFCVTANGNPDAPPRNVSGEGLSYTTWSHGGKSFMFVARMPENQVADLAQTLVDRF
jgi:anti-sigma factor RsiW